MDDGKILSKLVYHIQTGYLSYSEIDDIFDLMPDHCKYSGIAYRAISCAKENIDYNQFKNLYWSKSLDGIEAFLDISKKSNCVIVESEIINGLDLNEMFLYLNSKLPPEKDKVNNPYANEQEILVLDYKNFKVR